MYSYNFDDDPLMKAGSQVRSAPHDPNIPYYQVPYGAPPPMAETKVYRGPNSSIGDLDPTVCILVMMFVGFSPALWAFGESRNMFLKRIACHHLVLQVFAVLFMFCMLLPFGILLVLFSFGLFIMTLTHGTEVAYVPGFRAMSDSIFLAVGGRFDNVCAGRSRSMPLLLVMIPVVLSLCFCLAFVAAIVLPMCIIVIPGIVLSCLSVAFPFIAVAATAQ